MIRHLPHFAIVAEEEHFQRAAERLGITQSALSRRVQLLEEELGVKLFERKARGVRLTPAGESFYNDVRKVQAALEEAKLRAQNIMLGRRGRVEVGLAPNAVSNPIVGRMFRIIRAENPDVEVAMKLIYSEDQLHSLQMQRIDFGILYKVSDEKWLSYAPVSEDRLMLAIPAAHALARKRRLRIADLGAIPFIAPSRAHSPRIFDRLIATCHASGFSPNIEVEVHSEESALSIVAMGFAAGFVSRHHKALAPHGVVVREIEDFAFSLPLSLAWRSDFASPVVAHFNAALRRAIADTSPLGSAQDLRHALVK
jgi:DNA-binding transcriptional LysR family regulator